MRTLAAVIRNDIQLKQQYFLEAEDEIRERNFRLLKNLSFVTAALLPFFFGLAWVVIPGWSITLQHILLFPTALLFHLITVLFQKKIIKSNVLVMWLCLLFSAAVFSFAIWIDVFSCPDAPSCFIPLLYIVLPSVFILRFSLIYPLMFFFGVVYIAGVCFAKAPNIAPYDVFSSIAGFIFSIVASQATIRLRIRDHDARTRYKRLSSMDALTGLLNKSTCEDAISRYLYTHNPHVQCTLLFLDVDNFKSINDSQGHYTGDALLQRVGNLLTDMFRSTDIVGRFGGDEFLILIKELSHPPLLELKCRAILDALHEFSRRDGGTPVTCSIGGFAVQDRQIDFQTLLRGADDALYEAKNAGRDRFVLRVE